MRGGGYFLDERPTETIPKEELDMWEKAWGIRRPIPYLSEREAALKKYNFVYDGRNYVPAESLNKKKKR